MLYSWDDKLENKSHPNWVEASRIKEVVSMSNLPLIADADTGFGEAQVPTFDTKQSGPAEYCADKSLTTLCVLDEYFIGNSSALYYQFLISNSSVLHQYFISTSSELHNYFISSLSVLQQYLISTSPHQYFISSISILHQYFIRTVSIYLFFTWTHARALEHCDWQGEMVRRTVEEYCWALVLVWIFERIMRKETRLVCGAFGWFLQFFLRLKLTASGRSSRIAHWRPGDAEKGTLNHVTAWKFHQKEEGD